LPTCRLDGAPGERTLERHGNVRRSPDGSTAIMLLSHNGLCKGYTQRVIFPLPCLMPHQNDLLLLEPYPATVLPASPHKPRRASLLTCLNDRNLQTSPGFNSTWVLESRLPAFLPWVLPC
jgi:hypothetical protein